MGHERVGVLPKTRPWRKVVAQIADSAGSGQEAGDIAEATLRNVRDRLQRIQEDQGVKEAFKFLLSLINTAASSAGPPSTKVPRISCFDPKAKLARRMVMMKVKLAEITRRVPMCVIVGGFLILAACSGGGPTTPVTTSTNEDVVWLAKLMASEAGSISDVGQAVRATDAERSAVAWTALNRLKAGAFGKSVHDVVTAPGQFAYGKDPTSEILDLAGKLLKGQIPDLTSGATHFFSPIGMPKEGESTDGFDVGGGLHVVPGLGKKVYFPLWTTKLAWVGELQDVRQKYYVFYRPSGASTGVVGSSQPHIVFQSRDRSQIFIANADGTGIRLIANGDNPIWSPDGEQLAYQTVEKAQPSYLGDTRTLWLLTSRGPSVQLHRTDRAYTRYVAWAPDSAHLLFLTEPGSNSSFDFDYDLYLVKWDGTNKVRVGKQKWWTHVSNIPKWSPDGSRIAYVNEFENLVVLNSDGTQSQRLAANVEEVPEWSPDGKRIAFGRGFVTLASGAITKFPGSKAWFSPDGGMVAYIQEERGRRPRVVTVDQNGNIGPEVARVDSEGINGYFADNLSHPYIFWSPDGQKILFGTTAFNGGIGAIYVLDIRSGKTTRLLEERLGTIGSPRGTILGQGRTGPWSLDGKVLLYEQQGHAYVVNPDGTGRIDLGEGERPQWSPDGKKITYGQTETFGQEVVGQYIFVVNPDGTGKVKIADGINPRWIPASSW